MKSQGSALSLIIIGIIWGMNTGEVFAQSAIGQLEGLSGQIINRGYTASGVDYSAIRQANAAAAAERKAAAERRARQEALKANEQGNVTYRNGLWESAVSYYRKALRNSPSDQEIRNNLKMAKERLDDKKQTEKEHIQSQKAEQASNKKIEEQRLANDKRVAEQREAFEKKKQPLIALIQTSAPAHPNDPQPSPKSSTVSYNSSFGGGDMPAAIQKIGGLTEQEWAEARASQKEIDNIKSVWPVPSKDLARLETLETRRDNLWRKAISVPGLTSGERERLKLKLYTAVIYANESSAMTISQSQISEWKKPVNQYSASTSKPDALKLSPVMTMLNDMATDNATDIINDAGADFSKNNFGKVVGPMFGDALAVTSIALTTTEKGVASGISKSIDFAIGKVRSPRAELAREGGKIYKDYAQKSFDLFMEEMNKFNAAMGLGGADKKE